MLAYVLAIANSFGDLQIQSGEQVLSFYKEGLGKYGAL